MFIKTFVDVLFMNAVASRLHILSLCFTVSIKFSANIRLPLQRSTRSSKSGTYKLFSARAYRPLTNWKGPLYQALWVDSDIKFLWQVSGDAQRRPIFAPRAIFRLCPAYQQDGSSHLFIRNSSYNLVVSGNTLVAKYTLKHKSNPGVFFFSFMDNNAAFPSYVTVKNGQISMSFLVDSKKACLITSMLASCMEYGGW